MNVATETRKEYEDKNYGRLLYRCACDCGYRTLWYPRKDFAQGQMAYHAEQNHQVVRELVRTERLYPAGSAV